MMNLYDEMMLFVFSLFGWVGVQEITGNGIALGSELKSVCHIVHAPQMHGRERF